VVAATAKVVTDERCRRKASDSFAPFGKKVISIWYTLYRKFCVMDFVANEEEASASVLGTPLFLLSFTDRVRIGVIKAPSLPPLLSLHRLFFCVVHLRSFFVAVVHILLAYHQKEGDCGSITIISGA
jgi:hypothetical protein